LYNNINYLRGKYINIQIYGLDKNIIYRVY